VATCIDFDADRATDAWNRALAIDPQDAEARVLRAAFDVCYIRGAFDDAIREVSLVIERDPLSALARTQLAVILAFAQRFDEAVAEARRAREIDPSSFFATWGEVNALAFGERPREALDILPGLLPRYGRHPWLMMALTAAFDRTDAMDLARAAYDELVARSRTEYVQPAVLAIAAEHARRRGDALAHLRRAVEIRDPVLGAFALHSPPMAKLRRDAPEFPDVIAALGLPVAAIGDREIARA
jgi:tetratricopeptide (TPR) repeat protein